MEENVPKELTTIPTVTDDSPTQTLCATGAASNTANPTPDMTAVIAKSKVSARCRERKKVEEDMSTTAGHLEHK